MLSRLSRPRLTLASWYRQLLRVLRSQARLAILRDGAEPFLGLLARSLPGDDPGGVPLRRAVTEAAHLADDRLGRPSGGRPGGEDVGERRVDRPIEGALALDDFVDEPHPLGPDCIEASTTRKERPRVGLARPRGDGP